MAKHLRLMAAVLLLMASGAYAQDYSWNEVAGLASDVGVGANGTVWIIGSANRGAPAMQWEEGAWVMAPQRKWSRVAVGPNGDAFAVNQSHKIYRWKKGSWQELPGEAVDIGVGADGSVYIVGTEASKHKIYKWTDGSWKDMPGSNYLRVSVDAGGNPYAVTRDNKIHRWRNGTWQTIDGYAADVAIGPDGSVFIVGTDANSRAISKLGDNSWMNLPDSNFANVAAGPAGVAWATSKDGKLYQLMK